MNIELRKPRISDAKRYLEILSHPEFTYVPAKSATLGEVKNFLRMAKEGWKKGIQYEFAVIANGIHVGATGIRINEQLPYICDMGYFIDHKYWNKGVATKAIQLLEEYIVANLDIIRIEITSVKKNIGSCKVAVKLGYKREGLMKKYLKIGEVYHDCYRYAKILK